MPNEDKQTINKSDLAYNYILDKIMDGEFAPGTVLSIRSISSELDISRTPVKDACTRLSNENLLNILPDKGITVTQVSLPDVLELYEVKYALEGYCAKLAAARRTDEDVIALQNCYNAHKQCASDPTQANILDDKFHGLIAKACYNNTISTYILEIIRKCRRASVFQNRLYSARIERSIEQHKAVLDAIISQDEEAACKAMNLHLEDVMSTTKELIIQNYYKFI